MSQSRHEFGDEEHQYHYCYALEVTRYVPVPEHDDFIDELPAKIEAPLEDSNEA